jgi:hypothetical protein
MESNKFPIATKVQLFTEDELMEINGLIEYMFITQENIWSKFKTRTSERKIISIPFMANMYGTEVTNINPIIIENYFPNFVEEFKLIMNKITDAAIKTIDDNDSIIPIQLFINLYENGNNSTPEHSHGCRQITLAFGAPRALTVKSKMIVLESGECIWLNGEKHSVPKIDETNPFFDVGRISFNLFYTTLNEKKFNVYS